MDTVEQQREAATIAATAKRAGVYDQRVLAALAATPRSPFLPDRQRTFATLDAPLEIGLEQTASQPSLIARMVEVVGIEPDDRVLEVGAGSGWQTALLDQLAASVVAVERHEALADHARAALDATGHGDVRIVHGDGMQGWAEGAPYDVIIVSAAGPVVPPALFEQLVEGGRIVQPLGRGGDEVVTVFERRGDELVPVADVCAARFVPLVEGARSRERR